MCDETYIKYPTCHILNTLLHYLVKHECCKLAWSTVTVFLRYEVTETFHKTVVGRTKVWWQVFLSVRTPAVVHAISSVVG